MSVILFSGVGLGIGGFISWLVEQHPHLLVSADSLKKDWIGSSSFIAILLIMGLAFNFYGLSVGNFSSSQIFIYGFLLSIVWTAAFFDIRYRLIPNRLLIVGIAGWICFASLGIVSVLTSLFAALSVAILFLLIRLTGSYFYQKAGMGIGDIKLVFLIGLFLQWEVFWAIYLAILAGGLWAISGLLFQKLNRKSRIPFAPFLWIGTSVAVFLSFNQFMSLWI